MPDGLRVETRKVSAIEGDELVSRVAFAEGESLRVSGVFIAYGTAGSGDFARKLGAQLDGTRIKATARRLCPACLQPVTAPAVCCRWQRP